MSAPFKIIRDWLENEKKLGSPYPDRMVLATAGLNAIPHSRIVAIREITAISFLFFTQEGTRKTIEMADNPIASATIWLPLQQRQIILEGQIAKLSSKDNRKYWLELPREQQLKFTVYSPSSSKPINSIKELEERYQDLAKQYQNEEIPITPFYCGYQLIPDTIYFYTLGTETFSEVFKYHKIDNGWMQHLLSP